MTCARQTAAINRDQETQIKKPGDRSGLFVNPQKGWTYQ
jgi:hypothetical protein